MGEKKRNIGYVILFLFIFFFIVFVGSFIGFYLSGFFTQKTFMERGDALAVYNQTHADKYIGVKSVFVKNAAVSIDAHGGLNSENIDEYLNGFSSSLSDSESFVFVPDNSITTIEDEYTVTFGDVYNSADNQFMLSAECNVCLSDGTFGKIRLDFSIEPIIAQIENLDMPRDCYSFILGENGALISHTVFSSPEQSAVTVPEVYTNLRAKMKESPQDSVNGIDCDGKERYFFYSISDSHGISVVMALVPSAWGGELNNFMILFVSLLIFASLIMCVAGFIGFRKLFILPINAAESATKAKSDFLSGMSHEIRTPINAILGMDELILRKSESPEITDYALNIQRAGRTLLQLIGDILDFSKIEAGALDLNEEEYSLPTMLNDIRIMLSPKAEEKGLALNIAVAPDMPTVVKGDEMRIKQIFTNLISNAVKYTENGSIRLKVAWEKIDKDKMILICSVKDTGIGIKPEDCERLFQAFQRLEENKHRSIEGTGLGMSITRQLLTLMDGDITVKSEYGVGSEFIVRIPQIIINKAPIGDFSKIASEKQVVRAEYKESFTAPDANLLVVDDNRLNLKIVSLLLKKTQLNIDTVESGEKCLEIVKQKKYHIILMDHMMPELDGIQTLKRLQTMSGNLSKDAAVIALTANALSGSREMYIENGFADYLPKPIEYTKMEELLVKYLPDELVNKQ